MSTLKMQQSDHSAHNMPGTKYAGDVLPFPKSLAEQDSNRLKGTFKDTPTTKFDPSGDMTGGGKVVKMPGVN